WTEKYRPKNLDELIGNEQAKKILRQWAKDWSKGIPKKRAVILDGKPGIGKTSCALALANEFGWPAIELNTSDARNAKKIKAIATLGSLCDTFDDKGNFVSSISGGRKLIILDEADNLYERIDDNNSSSSDMSDKGGKKAIVETVKNTKHPIILIVNDFYSLTKGSGENLKKLCNHIRFLNPYPSKIIILLRKICLIEKIIVDEKVLSIIAERCNGDIRSAVRDLQSLCFNRKNLDLESLNAVGYRDREIDIFVALKEIFKGNDLGKIRKTILQLNEDPKTLINWINENIAHQYKDIVDLAGGYEALSLADVFLGRTHRRQQFSLWSYACDIMNGGVSVSKSHDYPNDRYQFPSWIRQSAKNKNINEIKKSIFNKIGKYCHCSNQKVASIMSHHIITMMKNDYFFANKMIHIFKLSEDETEYLLGRKIEDKPETKKGFKKKIEEKTDQAIKQKNLEKQQRLFAL
ncbi:MAG: replication factor C large subunit, partial [Candidatus Thermoplasmatota archaeon]|nr:replication factor C large subunit [Candidatus Thermoplasmatota archaeon]